MEATMTLFDMRATRRRWLLGAGLTLAAAPLALATRASAAATTPKSDVKYQFTPNGEQHCSLCASFIAGDSPGGPGTCKIVEGPIPQNGWCQLYSKR
jgi:hypothetical protein